MKSRVRQAITALSFFACILSVTAQPSSGILNADEIRKLVPSVYFFRGQSASVQIRNTSGFRSGDRLVLAGLVDTSGYSSEVQAKYLGLLITEVKLTVGGTDLPPGQYGFGFKDGKFLVMDVGDHDLFNVPAQVDDKLAHPVPLKMVTDADGYRLYVGRKWVHLNAP